MRLCNLYCRESKSNFFDVVNIEEWRDDVVKKLLQGVNKPKTGIKAKAEERQLQPLTSCTTSMRSTIINKYTVYYYANLGVLVWKRKIVWNLSKWEVTNGQQRMAWMQTVKQKLRISKTRSETVIELFCMISMWSTIACILPMESCIGWYMTHGKHPDLYM